MIGIRNQENLVEKVTTGLVHSTYPINWNLVVPPGFGEDELGDQLAVALRVHNSSPILAVLSSDEVQGVDMFVRELHRQWSETAQILGPARGETAEASLRRLLGSLPKECPAVLVVKRFHKVLDSLESWVLGLLRGYERRHILHTATISPYSYEELKKRWRRIGHILTASNYGDTHEPYSVELLPVNEIMDICRAKNVPDHVSEYALELTGGYPEPFSALVDHWIRMGQPPLRSDVRLKLRDTAEQRLRRFVEGLDPPDETRYRELIINLHQRFESESAYQLLSYHPWRHVILDDDGLRAEGVGYAAVTASVREAVDNKAEHTMTSHMLERARMMYERRQYSTVLKLLDGVEPQISHMHIRILKEHASVMSVLYGAESSEVGVDTDWKKLLRTVKDSRKLLNEVRERILLNSQIESRYRKLEQVSNSIINAMSGGKTRVVDLLTGMSDTNIHQDAKTALLLLLLKVEAGRAIAGNTSACLSVLALPEQIFRLWAFWRLELNYYVVPVGQDEVWQQVGKVWPHGDVAKPPAGREFPSFELFAYFALAQVIRNRPDDLKTAPDSNFQSLAQSLSFFQIRRDSAHALSLLNPKRRQQYFDLIDRWLDSLFCTCPEPVSRDELLAIIEPLPIVDESGSVI